MLTLVKLKAAKDLGGGDVWVLTHGLALAQGRLRELRPIHVFTFLGLNGALPVKATKGHDFHKLLMALENKLSAVHHLGLIVRSAMSQLGDPIYKPDHVQDYDSQGRLIAATEAYLAAIYSVLEITALINRSLHPGLPIGFRRHAKKFPAFEFSKHEWLPLFYDIRTELVHFGTPHVDPKNLALIVDFSANQLEHFDKSKYTFPMITILKFAAGLFKMLDDWALEELKEANRDGQVHTMYEDAPGAPLRIEKTPVTEILELVSVGVTNNVEPSSVINLGE